MPYPYRYDHNVEVSGAAMSAVFNHYRREEVIESLEEHHLDYFEADAWYPVDQFIELLEEWIQLPTTTTNLDQCWDGDDLSSRISRRRWQA